MKPPIPPSFVVDLEEVVLFEVELEVRDVTMELEVCVVPLWTVRPPLRASMTITINETKARPDFVLNLDRLISSRSRVSSREGIPVPPCRQPLD